MKNDHCAMLNLCSSTLILDNVHVIELYKEDLF